MTLREYLEGLPADPLDGSSPRLLVAEGQLAQADKDEVTGDTYARRPFAVLVYRSRAAPRRTHDRKTLLTGAVDVNLYHPRDGLDTPNGDTLASLQALVVGAQYDVTEARPGYQLNGPLRLSSEVDPTPNQEAPLGGLHAVTRFTYQLWR